MCLTANKHKRELMNWYKGEKKLFRNQWKETMRWKVQKVK